MDFKIKQDTYNPLLKRKEVHVEIDHDGQGTPSRIDLRKAIATKYGTKPENVYVIDVETKTGTQSAMCSIQIYDDAKTAQNVVPKHIQIRNLPPDERKRKEEQAKKEEAKTKAEKAKPTEKPKPSEKPKPAEQPKEESKEDKTKSEAKPAPETKKT